jgi:glutamate formiminotransferase
MRVGLMKIVECVPNFSEGKNMKVVDAIVKEIEKINGVSLLDRESDPDHNRSVITFMGEPNAVKKAAFMATLKATELIDMNKHKGEHPRIGATDVIPFIPISDVNMEECVNLSKELGKEIADKLNIPIYLYAEAATKPDRIKLPDVRKGEYEGLKEEIKTNSDKKPDFGPSKLHPTAGATAVGARYPLIAFNVNLDTNNLSIAENIAKKIKESSGGFKAVQAKGFDIRERGIVQVSMNLLNYEVTSMVTVFNAIKEEAEKQGVEIVGSEIIGLVPMNALIDAAEKYLKVENFKKDQILELRLKK